MRRLITTAESRALGQSLGTGPTVTMQTFMGPLFVIAAITLLVVTLGTHFAVRAFDRSSAAREQVLAQNGITQRIEEVAALVVPQLDWDDAIRHLDNQYDAAWAEDNIGKYLHQTDGFDDIYVLGAYNAPMFVSIDGKTRSVDTYRKTISIADPLIARIRAAESARGPIDTNTHGEMVSRPIQADTLGIVNGKLAVVTATLVQPDFGKALPAGPRAPIVITAMDIDREFLGLFSQRYLLDGLHLRSPRQLRHPGDIEIATRARSGEILTYLAWRPLNPGYTMIRNLLPPLVIVACVLLLLATAQLYRIAKSARHLIWREREARALALHDPETGLPNELFLQDILADTHAAIEDGGRITLHVVHLDSLESASAMLGSRIGDRLVQETARRLSTICPEDMVLARLHDGKFVFLSYGTSTGSPMLFDALIRKTVTQPLELTEGDIAIRCSTGYAVTDTLEGRPDDLFHAAENNRHSRRRGTGDRASAAFVQ